MKKLAAIIAMLAGASALFAQSIFVVDFAQVHQNYYKTKAVVEQLQSAAASANAELKAMQEKLVAMNEELKALDEKFKNPALADAAKEEIKKEATAKLTEMRQLEQSMLGMKRQAEEKLANQQREVFAEHSKEILKTVEKIAADKKADFIFEKKALLFSKPTSDITEDVISALNANAPKK